MFVVTARATTFASAQAESMDAMRATLARTAMIFAARSDPKAIVLTATNARLFQYLSFNRFSSQQAICEAGERLHHRCTIRQNQHPHIMRIAPKEREQGQQAGAGRKIFRLHLSCSRFPSFFFPRNLWIPNKRNKQLDFHLRGCCNQFPFRIEAEIDSTRKISARRFF